LVKPFLLLSVLIIAAPAWSSPPAHPLDLQAYVDASVKAGHKRIIIPPGRYRVQPKNGVHLRLKDLHDITIVADRVEMVCTQTTCAVSIEGCSGLTLKGMTIDYDPLPYSEGVIVALSPNRSEHTIELFDGYPPASAVRPSFYEIYRPDTRTLRCDTYTPTAVDVLAPKRIRVHRQGGSPHDPEQIGDLVAVGAESAPGGVVPHAVTLYRSSNTRLVDIRLWASNCFGFLENQCQGSTYLRCRIDRRPPADDPIKRGSPRLRSLNADAFHSIEAARGPQIVDCTAKFMGDDAVNIHGFYSMVTACKGPQLRVLHDGAAPAKGDRVELLTGEGARLPDAVVVESRPDADITPAERAYLIGLPMHEPYRKSGLTHGTVVVLDRSVDLPMGSLVAPIKMLGDGFLVKGCDFGFNRSRGMVIKASNGQVIGNRITGGWMAAVLVSPEAWWIEAGNSSHVLIAHNTISNCMRTPIVVESTSRFGKVAPAGAHTDIRIEDNTISDCPVPAIRVTSVRGLVLRGNRISGSRSGTVQMEQCEQTEVSNNPDAGGKKIVTPRIASAWITVYRPGADIFPGPSTAELTAGKRYDVWVPNDHTIVLGPEGRWHAIGITHPITSPANVHDGEQQLFHALAPAGPLASVIAEGLWTDQRKLLAPADRPNEIAPIYAPCVMRVGSGGYAMVYGPDPIRLAISTDLTSWWPCGALFHEEPTTRDPDLLCYNGLFYMVYCSVDRVMLRTSPDLRGWSEPHVILQMPHGIAPESPSLRSVNGAFYLFVCGYDGKWDMKTISGAYQHRTWVYRSDDPLNFDPAAPITELAAHAPEVFQGEDGRWYISSVEYPRRGLSIARLDWR